MHVRGTKLICTSHANVFGMPGTRLPVELRTTSGVSICGEVVAGGVEKCRNERRFGVDGKLLRIASLSEFMIKIEYGVRQVSDGSGSTPGWRETSTNDR